VLKLVFQLYVLSDGLFGNLLFIFSAFFVSASFTVATVPVTKEL